MNAPCLFQKKKRRRGSKDVEACVLAPLATEDPVDQLDGVQEENEEEEEEEMMRISPRSDSPRGQFLPLLCSGRLPVAVATAAVVSCCSMSSKRSHL